ncbi:MAG: hypothetical protein M3Y85_00975 [Bacteroidota bacterium]|nr:hypothetical protein [Bacteroidota bacterium]
MHKTIRHYFPDLFERFNNFTDQRKRSTYEVCELLTGCVAMFLLRETSRNAVNNDRKEASFRENYCKIFGQRLPHLDTVDDYLRLLDGAELEELKAALVAGLIEQKVFSRFKLLGKHYTVVVDATGTSSYTKNDESKTRLHKTSKNGKVTYYHHVLEAKLVTSSGFSISLLSEWLVNDNETGYNKQDCEHSAFKRLAKRLKACFPRLPICIVADWLYPNQPFMEICKNNAWEYLVVLKDDSLKTLQEDITDIKNQHRCQLECCSTEAKGLVHIKQEYKWIKPALTYRKHTTYWLSCTETITRYDKTKTLLPEQDAPTTFVWLSSQPVTQKNVRNLSEAGRNRWKIENEGFNTQKNGGYNLGHKFSRKDFTSYKNYYQCMQLAHLISQLAEHSSTIKDMLKADKKLTIKHLWKQAIAWITYGIADAAEFGVIAKCQIRLQ